MHRIAHAALLLSAATLAAACTRAVPETRPTKEPAVSTVSVAVPPPSVVATAPEGDAVDERFAAELKTIFASYKPWGRVDDELRWAPFLCRIPQPGRAAMSAAREGGHGRKLYSLFAKNRNAYVGVRGADARPPPTIGQVIVKESYVPEVVKAAEPPFPVRRAAVMPDSGFEEADHFDPYVTTDGVTYRAETLAGVYVMLRKDPSTPGTDEGWIYGTLKPDGELTSAGRVASCMGCHTTKPGRLFGRPGK
jgi:hypothetical protein